MNILAIDLGTTTEEWRLVDACANYEVSSFGRVRRILATKGTANGKVLKPLLNKKTGYYAVSLSENCKQKRIDIHRLVAIAFIGPPPSSNYLVAHNDGTRSNNHFKNLRWATQRENLLDMRAHGTAMTGSRNPMSKLDEIDRKAIVKMMGLGIPRAVIAEGFGIGLRTVFRVLNSSLEGVA